MPQLLAPVRGEVENWEARFAGMQRRGRVHFTADLGGGLGDNIRFCYTEERALSAISSSTIGSRSALTGAHRAPGRAGRLPRPAGAR